MTLDDARLAVLLVALAFVTALGIRRIRYRRATHTWPMVLGSVTSTRIELRHNYHFAIVNYSYTVNGAPYAAWHQRPFILQSRAKRWLERFRAGDALRVRYNPKQPLDSWIFANEHPGLRNP